MRSITSFNANNVKHTTITGDRSPTSVTSVDSIMDNDESYDSFRRFTADVVARLQMSDDRSLTASIQTSSDKSEVYDIYKQLDSGNALWNVDNMTDQNGDKIQFIDLFLVRYKQVCKDRKTVRESDLRDYADVLEAACGYQKRSRKVNCFSNILKF